MDLTTSKNPNSMVLGSAKIEITKSPVLINTVKHDWTLKNLIPVTLVFEWDGKDGSRKRVEAKPDLNRNGAIRNYTWEGYINFAYVPLPYEKKIDYTLIYDKGEFLKDRNYPLVYKLVKEGERVKAVDMTELLEKDRTLWKAHFVVGEGNVKGSPDRSKKPARD